MKLIYRICLLPAILLMSAVLPDQNSYTLSNDYTVVIQGTSNLHDWSEKVGKVSGSGVVNWNNDGSFDLNAISIIMDVFSIKSDNSIMDGKTYKALKADNNPEITFTSSAPLRAIKINEDANTIAVNGNLTIAGVTKPVTMLVKVSMADQKKLVFQGSQQINMTDYGISPPTAMFGMLKTGDVITLNFFTNFVIANS